MPALVHYLKKTFPTMEEVKLEELSASLEAVLKVLKIHPAASIEATYRSVANNTITIVLWDYEIEIGLDSSFGPPRKRPKISPLDHSSGRPPSTDDNFHREEDLERDLVEDMPRGL